MQKFSKGEQLKGVFTEVCQLADSIMGDFLQQEENLQKVKMLSQDVEKVGTCVHAACCGHVGVILGSCWGHVGVTCNSDVTSYFLQSFLATYPLVY